MAPPPLLPTPAPPLPTSAPFDHADDLPEPCDLCGSERTVWRTCKLICLNCNTIVKSCADL